MKQRFEIPYKPDSVNDHWSINKDGKGLRLNKKGREFREAVQWYIKSKKYITFTGKIKVNIELYFKDNRKQDIDNYFKAILDSFNGFLYTDDSFIYQLKGTKKLGCGRDYFVIEVEELEID
nr:MAG TPA: Endodeoxyribonuclease RusA [Caudoviricetes sp.]